MRLDHLLSRELVKDEPVVPALGHTASLNVDRAWRSGARHLRAGHTRQIARGALLSFERPGRGIAAETSRRTLKTAQLANASGFHRSVRCLSRHRMELITVKI